ncbi:MAG TPA: 1-deoxy-D-xylulose-5-phosphate reductoisomerase [Selenomonadales bacterium]|nr:1-deoxy-D-xylulose-5-phosphate reductoisomerase [Selenomonadales bacterium]
MPKPIAILGSTGSVGTQALDVIAAHPEHFSAAVLAAHGNDGLLEEQIERFKPEIAVLADVRSAERLRSRYRGRTQILAGEEGLLEAAVYPGADIVLTSLVGFAGLKPTLAAIGAGKTIALANKETLVAAGELVTSLARANKVQILPVDSEHSAIFQCLCGLERENVRKLLVTASGGPFRGKTARELQHVTLEQCLRHPNWSMGRKITVDSATLANKGLEVIEARWLYDMRYDQIEVVVHPQSIIHSMVELVDGAVIAQLGAPDMRGPIQYALTYPGRLASQVPALDFQKMGMLTFEAPDTETFPALQLAYAAGRTGGTMPCVFNAANEVAVTAFLRNQVRFLDIPLIIGEVMRQHTSTDHPALAEIFAADQWARDRADQSICELTK